MLGRSVMASLNKVFEKKMGCCHYLRSLPWVCCLKSLHALRKKWKMFVVSPSDNAYYRWLFVIATAVLYNWFLVVARWSHHYHGYYLNSCAVHFLTRMQIYWLGVFFPNCQGMLWQVAGEQLHLLAGAGLPVRLDLPDGHVCQTPYRYTGHLTVLDNRST